MQQLVDSYRLPASDFERVARHTRLTPKSLAIAREVLVEGKEMAEVGTRHHVTRQRVMAIRDRFYSAYLHNSMYPPGWVRASVCAPKEMLDSFLTTVEQERIKYFSHSQKD